MIRRTSFVSVNLTPAARDELRAASIELTSEAGSRLSMSDLLLGALRVALDHRSELLAHLIPALPSESASPPTR